MRQAVIPFHPRYEGHDHINVYSKSKSPLGRALSNFFYSVFTHPRYGVFNTVEGFYFYLLTGCMHNELRTMKGIEAKTFGSKAVALRKVDQNFKNEIVEAIAYKIMQNVYIQNLLIESTLPLTHYYYYGDVDKEVKVYDKMREHGYMIHAIEEIRQNLQQNGKIITTYNQSKRDPL